MKTANTKLGLVLVDARGRTLYHLSSETASHIVCTAQCATKWPPLLVSGGAQPTAGTGVTGLTVVMRPEGTDQVAASGQPLYTYSGDAQPGDTNGDGVGGVWHVVKVQSSTATSSSGATASTYGY